MSIHPKYVQSIKSGNVVAFPTETVYGLGADTWNEDAIRKVFETKGRPSDNPLIIHISDLSQLDSFVSEIPEAASILMNAFWPGPLSIILKKKKAVLDIVTAGLETVALRMPNHPIALEFISQTGPLVAPSANTSGKPSPTKASHVRQDFGADFNVIDGEATQIGLESTVIDLSVEVPTILRPGIISKQQIEELLGNEIIDSSTHYVESPRSPGQKYTHYKPSANVRWLNKGESCTNLDTLYLLVSDTTETNNVISYCGDIPKLARELYDRFRQADDEGYSSIVIESMEKLDSSLTPALFNRIKKAIG